MAAVELVAAVGAKKRGDVPRFLEYKRKRIQEVRMRDTISCIDAVLFVFHEV